MKPIECVLNLAATTSQNARKHWREKSEIAKKEKNAASIGLRAAPGFLDIRPLLRVTLTRVGPRALDSDNLAGTLKAVRDGIAARLRIDDGSPLIEWTYAQARGEYAVRVRVEFVGECVVCDGPQCGRCADPLPPEAPDQTLCAECAAANPKAAKLAAEWAEPFDADDHNGREFGRGGRSARADSNSAQTPPLRVHAEREGAPRFTPNVRPGRKAGGR